MMQEFDSKESDTRTAYLYSQESLRVTHTFREVTHSFAKVRKKCMGTHTV